jgi:hypothetical protein
VLNAVQHLKPRGVVEVGIIRMGWQKIFSVSSVTVILGVAERPHFAEQSFFDREETEIKKI